MNDAQKALTEEFAIGICLSKTGDLSFDEILESLYEGHIPNNVVAWEPFEWQSPSTLADTITDMELVLLNYGRKLLESK